MCISAVGTFFKKLDCCPNWSYQDRAQAASLVALVCCVAVAIVSGQERVHSCQQVNCDTQEQRDRIIDKRETLNNWACGLAAVGAVFAFISFVYLSKCCGQSGSSSGDGSPASSLPGRTVSSGEDSSSAGSLPV
ncbi:MAG: hypothetical protein KR126chlam3_00209 [Chlamydiae bacterium]|nr:hypothetical protein [Chlamydiota bacterium]